MPDNLSKGFTIESDVALTQEQVWDILADTNRIGEIIFKEKPSKVVKRDTESSVLSHKSVGEFEEFPWVFEVPSRFKVVRVFSHKLLKKIEQECIITKLTETSSHFKFSLTMEASGGLGGGTFLKIALGQMQKGMNKVEALLKATAAKPVFFVDFPVSGADQKKLRQRVQVRLDGLNIKLSPEESAVMEKITHSLCTGGTFEVSLMRPYQLAKAWQMDKRTVLTTFLRACHAGILRLSWDIICPSCTGGPTIASLKDIPASGHCPSCDITFDVDFAEVSHIIHFSFLGMYRF